MSERTSSISRLFNKIANVFCGESKRDRVLRIVEDVESKGSSVSLPSPIDCPNSPANLVLLEKQMPQIRKRAQELFNEGKINKERLEYMLVVSAEGLAYEQLKLQNPNFNWTEWELGGSH